MRPILVTGGSGFLGSYVVTELYRRNLGGRVHLMLRKFATPTGLLGLRMQDAGLSVEELRPRTHLVDFQDEANFFASLKDLETISQEWVVIHLAAIINAKGNALAQEKINVGRSEQLLDWTNAHGKRFIFTSSITAFGATPTAEFRTEADYDRYHPFNKLDLYSMSKRKAHDSLLKRAKVDTVIFCPAIIHGRYEHEKNSRGHLKRVLDGSTRIIPGGGGAFVTLDNVGNKLIGAATEEDLAPGRVKVELLVDVCLTYRDYFDLYRKSAGLDPYRVWAVPSWFSWIIAPVHWVLRRLGMRLSALGKVVQALMFYYFKSPLDPVQGKAALLRALEQSHDHD